MVLEVGTKKNQTFVILVSEIDEMRKNHDDKLGVHRGGFKCYNTRKKNQDDKRNTCIKRILVEKLTQCNKDHDDEL